MDQAIILVLVKMIVVLAFVPLKILQPLMVKTCDQPLLKPLLQGPEVQHQQIRWVLQFNTILRLLHVGGGQIIVLVSGSEGV